ncbi:MAG: hypothetical protein ACM3KL_02175 [Alphaproteobacteria bacterium]
MKRHFFTATLIAACFASPVLATPPGNLQQLHLAFVTTTGPAEPGDTTFYTVGQKQFGVGRLASVVDIDGEQVTFEVLVSLEYTDGSGPFTGFLSLLWPNGDAVVCRYDGVVVRDAAGDSRWNSNLHVIDGSGSLTNATGNGTLSGFRSAALGGSVDYAVDLTIHPHNGGQGGGGSENANGGSSGIEFGNPGDIAIDVVLTGAPEDQRLRNVGFDDSFRYGIFRIAGDASGPLPAHVSALGTLGYRMGSGPFAGFLVLDYGGDHVLYCRYEGHTTQLSVDSTRILGRLDVIAGTGMFDGAQGQGEVRARRGGPVGSTQLTSIRLRLH